MKRVLLLAAVLLLIPASLAASADDEIKTVVLQIHHSRFHTERLEFEQGERVRFVVQNMDPIDHELIIGGEEVQLAHENGTEPVHRAVPGEVTVFAGESESTTYQFERSGNLEFACHYPGHYEYGMKGTISVRTS